MSIKNRVYGDNNRMEHRVDMRSMSVDLDRWGVRIKRVEHLDFLDGAFVSAQPFHLDVTISAIDKPAEPGYNGHISPREGGSYKLWGWYKTNVQRRREFDPEKIQPVIDRIWSYWQTDECQAEMLRQSIKAAEDEAAEMDAQLQLTRGWIEERQGELKALEDAAR